MKSSSFDVTLMKEYFAKKIGALYFLYSISCVFDFLHHFSQVSTIGEI